jgi:transcriptional regulator with XRE-family HTH domain
MDEKRAAEAMGLLIREMRRERRLTQTQLAGKTGLSIRQINNIESGHRPPYVDEVFLLADGLEVQAWVLTRKLNDLL